MLRPGFDAVGACGGTPGMMDSFCQILGPIYDLEINVSGSASPLTLTSPPMGERENRRQARAGSRMARTVARSCRGEKGLDRCSRAPIPALTVR